MREKKGFVFTLDAMFSVFVAIILATSAFFLMSKSHEDHLVKSQMTKFANDLLIVLEKDGILDSMSENQIEGELEDVLPINYAAEVKVESYIYQNGFRLKKTVTAKYPEGFDVKEDAVTAKGSFLTFQNERIDEYSLTELRMWLR